MEVADYLREWERVPGSRIALVASSFHPYVGGVEEHVRQVAREFRRLGHDVVVWTVDRGEHLGVRQVDGVEVRYLQTPLPAQTPTALARFVARSPAAAWAWWRAYRAFRPDVIQVHCFGPNGLYAVALATLTRTTLVVSAHGETFMDDRGIFERSALIRAGLRRALERAALVTGCSEVTLEDLRSRFALRGGVVVPNGVDLTIGPGAREPQDPPIVFAVGRIEHSKGFDLLVRAFDAGGLARSSRLVIGGDGSLKSALTEDVRRRGLDHAVTFTGLLDQGSVARWMAEASVVVVPSRKEAFGIVVLEAWRSGTPLVVTDRGGPAEFVHNAVDALVVDPSDAGALAGAIGRILGNPELASSLGERGLRSVQDYTWRRVAQRYAELIAETTP